VSKLYIRATARVLKSIAMERRATIQNERGTASSEEHVVFNPADDSTSSYEVSAASEDDRQELPTIKGGLPAVRSQRRIHPSTEKTPSKTTGLPSKDLLTPSRNESTRANVVYTDEQIKEDAARWASTFTGLLDSQNVSQDEMPANPRSRPLRRRSNKRKAEKLEARKYVAKRPKGPYNDSYRQLLNQEISDALVTPTEPNGKLLQSQIGVTVWTPNEKESFFTALSRLGKDNVREIASRIGSKTEFEVQEYIQLLRQGLLEKTTKEPRRQLLGFTDMPAAVQISQECCDELEKAADALASRQNRYEEQKEQQKRGDSWLLNSDVNLWVEEHLADEGGSNNLREVLPAAELLNLCNWLELSTRVFMNPAPPREGENWQSLVEPGERPSIRATAFADFHRLAVSVTKRLVSTTIFCTMSRLRAMDLRSFNRYDIVKPADVQAAAKIIGLEVSSHRFWRNCPRRCNLNIVKSTSAVAGDQSPMDYDEVEDVLNKTRTNSQPAAPSDRKADRPGLSASGSPETSFTAFSDSESSSMFQHGSDSDANGHDEDPPDRDLAVEYMQGVELEYSELINPSGSEFEHPHNHKKTKKRKIMAREALYLAHAEYIEALDVQASLIEEQRLWKILKQEPPFAIKPEEVNLPKRPIQERKGEDELRDWRDQIEFWSQWETLDQPVPSNAFALPSAHTFRRRTSIRNAEVDGSSSEGTSGEDEDGLSLDEDKSSDENSNQDEPYSLGSDSGRS
jgi:RNA polymerase I-specific transcription initiation factor RRN5